MCAASCVSSKARAPVNSHSFSALFGQGGPQPLCPACQHLIDTFVTGLSTALSTPHAHAVNSLSMSLSPPLPARPARDIDLPQSGLDAVMRGLKGACPRCGEAKLFRKWLKPKDTCPHCKQDWSRQQADDFPAYIGIFVVGHLLAPVVIAMITTFKMSAWAVLATILPVAVVMLIATLQPVKGAVIAFLYWHGIGAFSKERRAEDVVVEETLDQ